MLALPIALLVGVGPLFWGAEGLGVQTGLFLGVCVGAAFWVLARLAVGYLPLPSNRNLAWTASLALLSGLAAVYSPVPATAGPQWRVLLLGLWLFPAVAALSKDGRALVDQAIRVSAWALVLLAFRQRFSEGGGAVAASLPSPEAFGGLIVLLLPLAAQVGDYLLVGGLVAALCWSGGLGAWLGLSVALLLSRRRSGEAVYRLGGAIGFVCLVVLYSRLQSPEVLERWRWWGAAAAMAAERPWLGFGPGVFRSVMGAFVEPGWRPSETACQHLLQTAAECGLPFALLWLAGLARCLGRGSPHKRFGAAAALIESLWDGSLAVPACYWLLCYFLASSAPETSRGADVPASRKLPAAFLVLALAFGSGAAAWRRWQAERSRAEALAREAAGGPADEVLGLLERSARLARDPEVERLRGQRELAAGRWERAAEHYERAAELDPYRPGAWRDLDKLYRSHGRPDLARLKLREGAATCPALRR